MLKILSADTHYSTRRRVQEVRNTAWFSLERCNAVAEPGSRNAYNKPVSTLPIATWENLVQGTMWWPHVWTDWRRLWLALSQSFTFGVGLKLETRRDSITTWTWSWEIRKSWMVCCLCVARCWGFSRMWWCWSSECWKKFLCENAPDPFQGLEIKREP